MTTAALAVSSTGTPVAPSWSLMAFEAVTGRRAAILPISDQRWSRGLMFGDTSFEATVPLDGPPRPTADSVTRAVRDVCVDGPRWLLVSLYGSAPIAYGFVASPLPTPAGVRIGTIDLYGLLARRLLLASGQWANPSAAAANVSIGPTTLPNIARTLLLQSIAEDGAELPLDIAAVATVGIHVRNYLGSDLASYGERLRDLNDDEGGPDLRVTPVLSADQKFVSLRVDIGEPYIGRWGAHHFEFPGNCQDVQPDYDYSEMAARHFVPGDGIDEARPVGVSYLPGTVDAGVPLMDRVDRTHGSAKDQGLLNSYAAANATTYQYGLESLTLTVAADTDPKLGTYAPGDDLTLRTENHWWLGSTITRRRIVRVSGDHTNKVKIVTAPVPEGV